MENKEEHINSPKPRELELEVKAKAMEIAEQLKDSDIPDGSTKEEEAVKRAQQWFLDMEG